MKYEIERLKGEVKIDFSLSAQDWDAYAEKAYVKTKGKYSLPGFRKGHAPKKVIEKYYGAGVFFDDAFNMAASECYSKALDENPDIIPVDEPKADIKDFGENGSDFKFSFNVTVSPEVTLGEYKGLEIEKSEYPTGEAEVEKEINAAREKAGRTVKITDRQVIDGDTVNLDYSGVADGKKFDGGTAAAQTLVIGSNSFIPGFEAQMIGMKIGETKDLKVKFPDEYHSEELKGKDAVFTVTLNEISAKELPAADDNFAKDVSRFETFAEYKADVTERLTKENNTRAENENKSKLIDKITQNATVEIPACMIESELDYMLHDFEHRLNYMYGGMKLDDYFKYTNSSREDFKTQRKEEAENSVKTRLVLKEIIKKEKIEVTDADFDAYVEKIALNAKKDAAEYKKSISPRQADQMKNDIIVTKTLDALVAANSFTASKSAKETKAPAKKAVKKVNN